MLIVLAIAGGCDIPRDPEHTLGAIRARGVIRVGVSESEPWIRRTSPGRNAEAAGVEARLIRRLAEDLGVRVEWIWGSLEDHYASLETFDLDLVAGGLTDESPWRSRVAFTRPYLRSNIFVGTASGARIDDLDGLRVAIEPGADIREYLEEHDAIAVVAPDPFQSGLPVGAPGWKLTRNGFLPASDSLHEVRHVLALPPGENGWLVTVEEFLVRNEAMARAALDRREDE